ncbi:enoyl-CoA hydratase [Desulfuromusa kysingii]|uniref:Enoyl-CoA hydratase n=1 Tax=Desulfuromusa kysingii TaxID=37625 RepID=A0A1H4BZN4_9BACT|nr:enoyl-CoA hydratase-related protein [Desulfuromusa kysingii]SEA53608.1 enoyl-CoA hydratase [Desulfuromusa kysingii]
MSYKNLQIEIEDKLAVVTLCRPEVMNALNGETLLELRDAFIGLAENNAVAVIIVTGYGEKAFVAGADIAAMQALTTLEARQFAKLGHQVMRHIEACTKPVIAAVNGFALGGGCELALGCDLRIVSENARFGQPEVGLGVIPGFGGTQRLARLIGKGRALELILTGNMIDAAEAYRIGLANKIVPLEQLLDTAKNMAATIISNGPYCVQLAKEAIRNGLELDLDRANQYEAELFGLCFATTDQKEGMQAFLDKRPAKFTGE